MSDANDIELLRDYADHDSERAFSKIVDRYINLVYSIALRFTASHEDAEDVTQAVFVILAQKAARIKSNTVLTGWLYETTRFTAMNFLTSKTRRQAREREAYMQSTLNDSETEDVWRQLAPLLEESMTRLSEKERTLLALRFFENRSGAETAARMGMNEWAARKRMERAVEKLRKFFAQQGVTVSSMAIAGAVSANSIHAAPVGLAKVVSAAAISKGAAASTPALILVKGALKIMAWTKAKTAVVAGAVVLLAAGTVSTVVVKTVINKKMEAAEAYRGQVWQQKYDVSIVDRLPPQVAIFPVLLSRASQGEQFGVLRNGKGVGLGVGVPEIMHLAYDVSLARMVFSSPIPIGRYDFIDNLPTGQKEALQQAVKKKFGLAGKHELIETNVLVLTMRDRNASGLRPVSGQDAFDMENGSISGRDRSFATLIYCLEDCLKIPVVNRTGLAGNFDFDLKWDATPDGLKRAVQQQFGLELVPAREAIEYVVVSKEK